MSKYVYTIIKSIATERGWRVMYKHNAKVYTDPVRHNMRPFAGLILKGPRGPLINYADSVYVTKQGQVFINDHEHLTTFWDRVFLRLSIRAWFTKQPMEELGIKSGY